jgi:hypothetical protein
MAQKSFWSWKANRRRVFPPVIACTRKKFPKILLEKIKVLGDK